MDTTTSPPQPPPVFTTSAETVLKEAQLAIHTFQKALDNIAQAVSTEHATFENVLRPLAHAENAYLSQSYILGFYQYVTTDEALREASSKAERIFNDYNLDRHMREDIFALVAAVKSTPGKTHALDPESEHFLTRLHHDFIKNGTKLSGSEKEQFREIQARITKLAAEFGTNSSQADDGGVWYTPEELQGIPEDRLARLEKGSNKNGHEGELLITFLEHVGLVLRFATNPESRKKMRTAMENRCNENISLFKEVTVLRDKAARLLGYSNHAALELEEKVAQTPETVNKLLENLLTQLLPLGIKELEKYKKIKQADFESRGEIWDGRYYVWDQPYYNRKLLGAEYSVDYEAISEYFPLQPTIQSMLKIFEQLFGLAFREARPKTPEEQAKLLWHEDVRLFSAWDDEMEGGDFLGYLYLDLYARTGKPWASAFPVIPGYTRLDGTRNYPAAALICNLPKPSDTSPSLLDHGDVVTLFHELGHGIHDLVSKTTYARFHGPSGTAVDFGEAPSQMLENWCWIPSELKTLSCHYSSLSPEYLKAWQKKAASKVGENSPPPPEVRIPDSMVDDLLRAKNVHQALGHLSQLAISIFDMTIHQPKSHEAIEKMNISQVYNRLRRECFPLDSHWDVGEGDEWGHGYTTYRNFIKGDYHAGYYGYFLSNVFSADIFETCFRSDLRNGAEGRRYRRRFLEKGGSRPEMEFVVGLLGREPDPAAFYQELGLK